MTDKPNRELCDEFRALLTTGFYASPGVDPDEALRITKDWRNDLWKAFNVLEERINPVGVKERREARLLQQERQVQAQDADWGAQGSVFNNAGKTAPW